MELARFAVVHYGAVALLTVVAYLAGRGLTWRCRFDSALERFTVSTGLGLGLVALLALMLGLLRILTPIAVIGAAAALLAASLAIGRPWRNAPRALLHRGTRSMRRAGFLLVALPAVGLLALLPLYPPTAWDATMYHLATAKLYATRHAVEFSPYIRFQTFPQVNELLYTLMLLVSDDVPAQIVHFGMALLTALVLYVWGTAGLVTGGGAMGGGAVAVQSADTLAGRHRLYRPWADLLRHARLLLRMEVAAGGRRGRRRNHDGGSEACRPVERSASKYRAGGSPGVTDLSPQPPLRNRERGHCLEKFQTTSDRQ